MKSTRILWGTVGIASFLSTLLFLAGFVYAAQDLLFPKVGSSEFAAPVQEKTEVSEMDKKSKIQIVALGDSLTAGTGDVTGKGYVSRVREKLEAEFGKPTFVLNNLAIPGYRSGQLLSDMALKKTTDALAQADVILLTIGGNDIFDGGAGIFNGQNEEFDPSAAEKRLVPALNQVDQILTKINAVNPNAIVIYVGLYHPFLDMDKTQKGSLVVQKWNDGVFAITNRYPHMVLVPTYDLFSQNLNKYIFFDHFHPNQDGYERIADRIAQILK